MDDRRVYDHVKQWRNKTKSHKQENQYKGTIHDMSLGHQRYYDLPRDYYGFQKRKEPVIRQLPAKQPRSRKPVHVSPLPSPPPRHKELFSPLLIPTQLTPSPHPLLPVTQGSPTISRYPLIPVAPPFYSPEPEKAPAILSSTPINPYRYEPLYKPRPQPVFPPLIPVERPRDSFNRGYRSDPTVPGYNAVGSILRSLRMQRN